MDILNENMTYSSDINLEEEISKLLAYMRESGEFSGDAPRLVLIKDDVENARKITGASAFYNPEDKSITLYSEGRHARDLICSYLHELTHYKQDLDGRLDNITTDNITEDENLAELEREAYEFSGMMFRKYKDSKKNKKLQINPFPEHEKELYEHLIHIVGEITLNPENSVTANGGDKEGTFVVGDIKYIYKIHSMDDMYDDGKSFYNIYFHPENHPINGPLNNTSKENYIKILNTMYNIILNFILKYKPDYIGLSSMDNNLSKNYHAVYNNLSTHNGISGYRRKNANMEFELENGEKGRFIVFQRKEDPVQEVCYIKNPTDKHGLNQFAREIMREIAGEEDQKYQLYCDMDEVLVAFDQGFKNMFGEVPSSYEKKYGRAELIAMINKQDVNFWNDLGFTQNGKAFWNSIKKYNPTIITAPSGQASEIGKRKWVKYNLGTHVPIVFAQADEKANYSGHNRILIDDNTSTIYDWINKGGIGIHYISAMNVINRLKELGI